MYRMLMYIVRILAIKFYITSKRGKSVALIRNHDKDYFNR
jgi:hypothetical protein